MKESFVMFSEYEDYFSVLSPADSHALLMAIFAYENRGEVKQLEGMALAFFMVIKNNLDRNREQYEKKVEARKEAGRRGGEAKKAKATHAIEENQNVANVANATFAKQTKQSMANVADNVPVPVPGNDNDHEEKENTSGAVAPDDTHPEPASEHKAEKPAPEEAQNLASLLFQIHRDTLDSGFKRTPAQLKTWALDIEKINRIDGRDWKDIEEVIRWAKADSFWARNIISADKLRAQFDKLLAGMRSGSPRDSPRPGAHWDSRGDAPAIKPQLKTNIFKDMPEYDPNNIEF